MEGEALEARMAYYDIFLLIFCSFSSHHTHETSKAESKSQSASAPHFHDMDLRSEIELRQWSYSHATFPGPFKVYDFHDVEVELGVRLGRGRQR